MKWDVLNEVYITEAGIMSKIKSLNDGKKISSAIKDAVDKGEDLKSLLTELSSKQISALAVFLNLKGFSTIQPNTQSAKVEKLLSHLKDIWS